MRKKRGGVIRRLKKHATRATARRDQTVCETFGLAGLREEKRSTTVIVPPPTVPEAEYLEVHFYPDHRVELALVKFPGDRRIPYEEKDE